MKSFRLDQKENERKPWNVHEFPHTWYNFLNISCGSPRGVVANVLDCDIVVSEFKHLFSDCWKTKMKWSLLSQCLRNSHASRVFFGQATSRTWEFTICTSQTAGVVVLLLSSNTYVASPFYQTWEAVSGFHFFVIWTFLHVPQTHCDSFIAWDGILFSSFCVVESNII